MTEVEQLSINALRFLAVDAVEKANSGHPGAPLGDSPTVYLLFREIMRHNPADPGWPELGPPVTAACLDLGLRGPHPSVVIGVDEPWYLACHCPPGALAPAGGSVVHVMRYGARDAGLDRAELHRFATLAGITDDQIVAERFLAVHVVTHVLPGPEDGLAGRPAVAVPGVPGLYLAGDWVGSSGWLSDAAMGSGRRAGMFAAGALAGHRTYPRVA